MITVSVIVPVYNVERYLRQCIDALLRQTLKDFEIICVDDGSTDGSAAILDEYARKDNRITVIHQKNAGAGVARNVGIERASGEYLFFSDPDDFSKRGMLEAMYRRAVSLNADVVVAGRLIYDGDTGRLLEKRGFPAKMWMLPQPFSAGDASKDIFTFCKNSPWDKLFRRRYIIDHGFRFQNLPRVNDCYFVSMALVCASRIGLLRGAYYCYRKDRAGGLQSTKDKSPECLYLAYDKVREELDRRSLFGQFKQSYISALLASGCYNLRTLSEPANRALSYGMLRERLQRLVGDCPTLTGYGKRASRLKMILANETYGGWFDKRAALSYPALRRLLPFSWTEWCKILCAKFRKLRHAPHGRSPLTIDWLEFHDRLLDLSVSVPLDDGITAAEVKECVHLRCQDALGHCENIPSNGVAVVGSSVRMDFSVSVDDMSLASLRFVWEGSGRFADLGWDTVRQGRFSALTESCEHAYFVRCGMLFRMKGNALWVTSCSCLSYGIARLRYVLEVAWRFPRSSMKAFVLYGTSRMLRIFHRKPIWLMSDRVERADDNARALFEYCMKSERRDRSRELVFAVARVSEDYRTLRRIGRVVDISGILYKAYFLLAEMRISAYHTGVQRCPFSKPVWECLKPAVRNGGFAYLCHGITKNDMSRVQGRAHMSARLLFTSSARERDFILSAPYGYTRREVKLCGMPRYDLLHDCAQRNITFMPTWRQYLTERSGINNLALREDADESRFFSAYREIFGDTRLQSACKRMGYAIRLMVHPNLAPFVNKFQIPEQVEIFPRSVSYREVFADSGIVVTDYSSIFFDVGYLHKPIVFFQADREEFFSHQYERGFFDYDRDGFGEVEFSVDGLVDRLIEYMENGAKMKPEYRKRVDDFFAFTDKNNCRRVYEAICEAVGKE